MYNPISDYALIGDTHSAALISRLGSIDWLCWPRHDSPALFLKILDDKRGGSCSIALADLESARRRYLPGTNILETTLRTRTGTAVLIDFMPVNPPTTLPHEGPDGDAESRLIRLVTCIEGEIEGSFTVHPTFDYARRACQLVLDGASALFFDTGEHRLRASASHSLALEGDTAAARFRLSAGEHASLVLTHGEDGRVPPVEGARGVLQRLTATRRYWEAWSDRCQYDGPYRDAVLRSVLCLKLLTYAPTGAIVAAPTAGLPEAVPGDRNFDYRYTWLRDASFTTTSFLNLGYVREAAEFLRFLCDADQSKGRDLHLMYSIAGSMASEEALHHLEGYRGARPVRIGNAASEQCQYDIYGELLLALHGYLEREGYEPPASIAEGLPEAIVNLAGQALAHRDDTDHGIWEVRPERRHFLHTKAMIWVALDRAAKIARRLGGFDEAQLQQWEEARDAVRAEYSARAWSEERGAFMQSYESDILDASVLRVVLFGALDADDPRVASTLGAVTRELGCGDDGALTWRYRAYDGFNGDEGAFLACSFWRVGCLALSGHTRPAKELFERLLARGNDIGLFAEEIDPVSGEQRGNYPQGFTHMAVINHALRLEACIARFGLRD